jgi:hypothetical protein
MADDDGHYVYAIALRRFTGSGCNPTEGAGQPSSLRNSDALRPSRRRNRLRKVTASE